MFKLLKTTFASTRTTDSALTAHERPETNRVTRHEIATLFAVELGYLDRSARVG